MGDMDMKLAGSKKGITALQVRSHRRTFLYHYKRDVLKPMDSFGMW